MTDSLSQMFANSFQKMIDSGQAQAIIDKHLMECFSDVVRQAVDYNSPFKKQLHEEFKSKFGFIPERANMSIYSEIISNRFVEQYSKQVVDQHADVVASSLIKKILSESRPDYKKYDFESFIETICQLGDPNEEDREWDDGNYATTHISIVVDEHSHGYTWVFFDFQKGKREKYHMDYSFGLDDKGRIFSVSMTKNGVDKVNEFLIKCKFAETELDLDGLESDSEYKVKYAVEE